jgi:hypothetical protein
MTLLNTDGLKVKFGRDLIEEITIMDSQVKALGDELKLEDGYAADPTFATNYENALNSVATILGNEKSRLEATAEALRTE